jgi:uncharacterized membrane protein YidH (DUF202 family)
MTEQKETLSPAEQQLELAYDRTIWAAERTLMAWTRTCLTLITFGFAIERLFLARDVGLLQYGGLVFRQSGVIGLSLVVLGVVVMNIAMFQHLRVLKHLELKTGGHIARWSLGLFSTVMLQLIGTLVTVFILSNMLTGTDIT